MKSKYLFEVVESNKMTRVNSSRNENRNKELYDNLIELSRIFKNGYVIQLINNIILFYPTMNKYYNVSYKIILEIKDDSVLFTNGKIPDTCIIKGWVNKKNNIYYVGIEI